MNKKDTMHRLAVIGSMDEFVELVKLAQSRGYYTIVCDGYPDGPAKKIADKFYNISVSDVDEIAEMCLRERVDGIIGSFSDTIFEQITKIAAKTGLRWYASPDMLPFYREKDTAKELMTRLGIRVPKNTVLRSGFSDSELEGFRFPLVIKPVDGHGSKGIYIAQSADEIRAYYSDVTNKGSMEYIIAEEIMKGKEYNMMNWVADGRVYPISIAAREKNPPRGNTVPPVVRIVYPAKNSADMVCEATDILQRFVDVTGQREGPLCMQFFYNDGGIEVCEIAGRIFGYEHELLEFASGLRIEQLLLDYVYEPERIRPTLESHSLNFKKISAGLYLHGVQDKVLTDFGEAERLGALDGVAEYEIYYNKGETVDNFGPNPYVGRYYLVSDSYAEIDRLTDKIFSELFVPSLEGDNAIVVNEPEK